MSFNASQRTNGVGVTQIAVGLSATVTVPQESGVNGFLVNFLSGTTCSIVGGASQIHSAGYPLTSGSAISITGPGPFYLAAAGATAVVAVLKSKSDSGV